MNDLLPGCGPSKIRKISEEEFMFRKANRIHTQTKRQRNYFPSAATAGPLCLLLLALFAGPAFGQGHVHELYYNNATWTNVDLTSQTSGPPATSQGGMAAFYTADKPNNQFHVYFVDDTSTHVQQLYFNGTTWQDEDLTVLGNGTTAFPYAMSGFAIGNLQLVFYVGTDNNVHLLYYNNRGWTDKNVTKLAGGVPAYFQGLMALVTKPNNQVHVYYQASGDGHLHQLYYNGSDFTDQDITSFTGGAYCDTDWLAGFVVDNEQHIFCPGYGGFSSNLDMLHIYYNNSSWVYEDVSYLTGLTTPMATFNVPVAAFQYPGQSQFEVYGLTDDDHVHQFTDTTSWADVDLSATIPAPDVATGGAVAFPTTPNDQFHFYYQPPPYTQIDQLYFNGTSWQVVDLPGGTGNVSGDGGMAGFAVGNLQYVFYISQD
jgi:hypothetical protein